MSANVLVFAGLDPGGGAGLAADILAIGAQGAHALPVATTLTAQDNNRVFDVEPVASSMVLRQAEPLLRNFWIGAIKIGIPGSAANAEAIAVVVRRLRERNPGLPVVLDPVLASGQGQALGRDDPAGALRELLALATVAVPNQPEAARLGELPCEHVLVTGGHSDGNMVVNRWLRGGADIRTWGWPRLPHEFHGSGCTLAAAIAARLAQGDEMEAALARAQAYTYRTLAEAFVIAPGQRIPRRILTTPERTAS